MARRIREYCLLARFDKPVGTWLLLFPALWALWLAAKGPPQPTLLVVFTLGAITMRAAGCVINDFADRDIDPYVARTRDRPLAARRVSPYEALALFGVLISTAATLLLFLNPPCLALAAIGAALTLCYPFAKRWFALPQIFLGISFGGWSVLMAYAAQTGAVPRIAWLLYIAAVLWSVAYDTIYAIADRAADLRLGVHSSAIVFADMDLPLIGIMQAMMLADLVLVGRNAQLGRWYFAGLAGAAVLFVYQQWLIRYREPAACIRAFTNNQYVGASVFVGLLLDRVYAA